MVWDVHLRHTDRHDLVHLKARWTGLGSIDDVSIDCAPGVHAVGSGPLYVRTVSALGRPIRGDFRWDADTTDPEVVLTWTDGGELGEQRIRLTGQLHHHSIPDGLRRLVHAPARSVTGLTGPHV